MSNHSLGSMYDEDGEDEGEGEGEVWWMVYVASKMAFAKVVLIGEGMLYG
jgi:hypothetical protein